MPREPQQDKALGVLEGFYGTPYTHEQRLGLIGWAGDSGARDVVISPKDDAGLRERWRDPLPGDQRDALVDLVRAAAAASVRLSVVISPGLDWRGGADHGLLAAKAQALYDAGVRSLGIAFDDVARGGAELGASHAAGVAAAVQALSADVRWAACPTDYALSRPTTYLGAFAAGLPQHVDVMWTGPGIVSADVPVQVTRDLARALGRRVVFADNVPVNDGPMSGVLHLGPYPHRDPELPAATGGLLLNLMPGLPLASTITAGAALRWWQAPTRDPLECWRESVAAVPGIEPLARGARSWLTDPGPDPELLRWARDEPRRLAAWLEQGCREGLSEQWQDELAPWLAAWEWEALLMALAIHARDLPASQRTEGAFTVAEGLRRARTIGEQLFGTRLAYYPLTRQEGDLVLPDAAGMVRGRSLSDIVVEETLALLWGPS